MRTLKWYHILLFALGGFVVLLIVYVLLRGTGVIDKFTSGKSKLAENEE